MITVFLTVILPVFFIFFVGFIGQRKLKMDIKSISSLAIFILMPTLVFKTFYTNDLDFRFLNMVVFLLSLFTSIVIIIKIISKIRKFPSSLENGLILSSGFMNSGNYGAPVILFAFGETAFTYSITFLVLQTIFMNSVGVYYAAKGNADFKTALKAVVKIPSIYAFFLAIILKNVGLELPESFFNVIELVSNATIPTVMLTLGMQLSQIKIGKIKWKMVSLGIILRLVISPMVGILLTMLLPIDPLLKNVLIVISAMPSAVVTSMLALQYDTEPELVSSTTFLTTIVSAFTLSILITLL